MGHETEQLSCVSKGLAVINKGSDDNIHGLEREA